jgi:hypothetical protein
VDGIDREIKAMPELDMREYVVIREFRYPLRRRWWQARVPPWTTALILSGAGLIGWIAGLHWI